MQDSSIEHISEPSSILDDTLDLLWGGVVEMTLLQFAVLPRDRSQPAL
jgi:hypothetical protein